MTGQIPPPRKNKPNIPPRPPKREHQPDRANLKNYIKENPNLTDLERLKIALQIAKLTHELHRSGNCNLNFSLENFQVKRTGENGEEIDISALSDFRKYTRNIDDVYGGVEGTFRNTDPNTTPPELHNPSDTPLVTYVTPSSDIWKMGQAFKDIGLEEVGNMIAQKVSSNRPKIETLIDGLEKAIALFHKQQQGDEIVTPSTTTIDKVVAEPVISESSTLNEYEIKSMSKYDAQTPPDKNTIYLSETGEYKIYREGASIPAHKGNISGETSRLYFHPPGENQNASYQEWIIKDLILDQLSLEEKDTRSTEEMVTRPKMLQLFEIELKEYTFQKMATGAFKPELGFIYLNTNGDYKFVAPNGQLHEGNCNTILEPYLNGLEKLSLNDKFEELINAPNDSMRFRFRQKFQKAILDKIDPPLEMEIDHEEPASKEEHRPSAIVFDDVRQSQLPLIISPLMTEDMREYRDQIFSKQLEKLPNELHPLYETLKNAKERKSNVQETRDSLEKNSLYWERALEIKNEEIRKKREKQFSDHVIELEQLVMLNNIISQYNGLIILENSSNMSLDDLMKKLDAIHKNIDFALGSAYFTRDNHDTNLSLSLENVKSLLKGDMRKLDDLKKDTMNNKPVSLNQRHRAILSMGNVIKRIRNFVVNGIRSLSDSIRRLPRSHS